MGDERKLASKHGRSLAEPVLGTDVRVIRIFEWHWRKVYGKGRKNEGVVYTYAGDAVVTITGDITTIRKMVVVARSIIAKLNDGTYKGKQEIKV